jgi:hypothetical protein
LFTAGIKSGLFAIPLTNVPVSIAGVAIPGQEAGKVNGDGFTFYAQIPPGETGAETRNARSPVFGTNRNSD